LQEAWDSLLPILELTRNQKAISEKLWMYTEIGKRRVDPKIFEYVSLISQYISHEPEVSFTDFFTKSLAILKPREQLEQKLEVLDRG